MSRKLNLKNYGGPDFETIDFSCEISQVVEAETFDQLVEAKATVNELVRKDVMERSSQLINLLKQRVAQPSA